MSFERWVECKASHPFTFMLLWYSLDLFKFSLSSSFQVFQSSSDFGVEGLQPIERARGRHHFYIRRYYIVNILFHNGMWRKYNFWKVLFVFSPGNIRPKSMTMRKIISTTREEEEDKDQILWRPGGKFWPLEEGIANACTYISETFFLHFYCQIARDHRSSLASASSVDIELSLLQPEWRRHWRLLSFSKVFEL